VEAMNNAHFMLAHIATSDPLMHDPNTTVKNVPTLAESNRTPKKNVSVDFAIWGLALVPFGHRLDGEFNYATHYH
jgi:hypothetical protein